jgi:hypothetical protein
MASDYRGRRRLKKQPDRTTHCSSYLRSLHDIYVESHAAVHKDRDLPARIAQGHTHCVAFRRPGKADGDRDHDLEEGLQYQPVWAKQRLFSILFSFFACLDLALSLVGLASTVNFAIARRTNELGIRMAVGAQRSHVVWMIVVRATLATEASGTLIGLLLNLSLEKALPEPSAGASLRRLFHAGEEAELGLLHNSPAHKAHTRM